VIKSGVCGIKRYSPANVGNADRVSQRFGDCHAEDRARDEGCREPYRKQEERHPSRRIEWELNRPFER